MGMEGTDGTRAPRRAGHGTTVPVTLIAVVSALGALMSACDAAPDPPPSGYLGAVHPSRHDLRRSAEAAEAAATAGRPLVHLTATGDTGTGNASERRTVSAMRRASARDPYDAVLLLGDIVYGRGDPRRLRRTVLRPFRPLTRQGAELVPALGNHDVALGEGRVIMRRLGHRHRHYAERVGPVRVVVLDTNHVTVRQTRWLRRHLRRHPAWARWTIVTLHGPPYSAGLHGSNLRVRHRWSPIFRRFHVPLVLAGHDHDYQRSHRIHGVTYVVSGGGAEKRPTGRRSFTAKSRSVRHFLDLEVFRDRIRVRALRRDGHVVDRFAIR